MFAKRLFALVIYDFVKSAGYHGTVAFWTTAVPGNAMGRVKQKYNRREAEMRFQRAYETVAGERCIYCGMPNDGKYDHQPPVYVLHRFADGGLVAKKAIRERFGQCKLVPCCTICNMGLGAFHGSTDNDRMQENRTLAPRG